MWVKTQELEEFQGGASCEDEANRPLEFSDDEDPLDVDSSHNKQCLVRTGPLVPRPCILLVNLCGWIMDLGVQINQTIAQMTRLTHLVRIGIQDTNSPSVFSKYTRQLNSSNAKNENVSNVTKLNEALYNNPNPFNRELGILIILNNPQNHL